MQMKYRKLIIRVEKQQICPSQLLVAHFFFQVTSQQTIGICVICICGGENITFACCSSTLKSSKSYLHTSTLVSETHFHTCSLPNLSSLQTCFVLSESLLPRSLRSLPPIKKKPNKQTRILSFFFPPFKGPNSLRKVGNLSFKMQKENQHGILVNKMLLWSTNARNKKFIKCTLGQKGSVCI